MRVIDMKATGLNLYLLMKNSGKTMQDIEEACGLASKKSIYKWFNGDRLPSIDNIVILDDMFGIDVGGIEMQSDMSRLDNLIVDISYVCTCLQTLKEILESGNCNDCGKMLECEFVPKWNQLVRYNCPHYERMKND